MDAIVLDLPPDNTGHVPELGIRQRMASDAYMSSILLNGINLKGLRDTIMSAKAFLTEPKAAPPLNVPQSSNTVTVRVIDR